MEMTLSELADFVGGELYGDGNLRIKRVSPIDKALVGDITFISNPRYHGLLEETQASAVIVSPKSPKGRKSQIRTRDPYLAFARIQKLWHEPPAREPIGVSSGTVQQGARVGEDPSIFPGAHIGRGTVIGDRVILYPGVFVGEGCRLGHDVTVFPNAVIYDGTSIGNRVTIHGGTVIGSDGFGYASEGDHYFKIVHAGTVEIEDEVEIGANCSIDRAVTKGKSTRIGRGTKIDNLVQIGHNVELGEDCLLVSQVGISGSARIERGAVIGGQVGIAGHITVGEGSNVGAQAGVTKSVPAHSEVLGSPAIPIPRKRREVAAVARLPDLLQRIRDLEARLKALENERSDEGGDRAEG